MCFFRKDCLWVKPIFREDRDKRAAEKVLVTERACGPKMIGAG